jgi:YbbR domain-containing protein
MILWLTILGRRDFVLNKTMDLDLFVGSRKVLAYQSTESVKVKVSGPRNALRKFLQNSLNNSLSVDLSRLPVGASEIEIPISRIELPVGVRLMGIKPEKIRVEIREASE